MSAKYDLPFKKGRTLYGGSVPTSGANYAFCGTEFEAKDSTTTSGRKITLRAVKNGSGITLYAKQPVQLNAVGDTILGYARLPDVPWVVLDDEIGAAGVVANDACFVHVKGPCTVKTAGASLIGIAAGDPIVAATAANSTAAGTTAAGVNRRTDAITNGTVASTVNDGVMARAITAATTNQTATEIRVNMDARLL